MSHPTKDHNQSPFWHDVLVDVTTSRELMRRQDYVGALDIAKNAKERIEKDGLWPKELERPEFHACCAIVNLIAELEKLVQSSDVSSGIKEVLKNGTSHRSFRN